MKIKGKNKEESKSNFGITNILDELEKLEDDPNDQILNVLKAVEIQNDDY